MSDTSALRLILREATDSFRGLPPEEQYALAFYLDTEAGRLAWEARAAAVVAMRRSGMTGDEVADVLGCGRSTVERLSEWAVSRDPSVGTWKRKSVSLSEVVRPPARRLRA